MSEIKEIKVMSINMLVRTSGEEVVVVTIGYKPLSAKPIEKNDKAKFDIQLLGLPTRNDVQIEIIANLFFTQTEWDKLKGVFVVGQMIELIPTSNGVEVSKVI